MITRLVACLTTAQGVQISPGQVVYGQVEPQQWSMFVLTMPVPSPSVQLTMRTPEPIGPAFRADNLHMFLKDAASNRLVRNSTAGKGAICQTCAGNPCALADELAVCPCSHIRLKLQSDAPHGLHGVGSTAACMVAVLFSA
jgi:hypothetical protein